MDMSRRSTRGKSPRCWGGSCYRPSIHEWGRRHAQEGSMLTDPREGHSRSLQPLPPRLGRIAGLGAVVLATAIVLASAAVGAAVRGAATPGQLDASFGQGGHAVVQLNPGCLQSCPEFKGSYADALTLQAGGKILLGGWETPGPGPGQPRAILARLDQNGTLDQSFAISGPTARATFEINHVYLLHDGRVLAVGEAEDGKI